MTAYLVRRNSGWYIAGAIIIVVIIIAGVLLYEYTLSFGSPGANTTPSASISTSPSTSPSGETVTITIFAGELSPTQYGFGNHSSSITSPGPSFTVKAGTTVNVKFGNAGSMGHNWALVLVKADANNQIAFPGAVIQSGLDPVAPAGTGQCTFVVGTPGTYYYICQVGSHVSLGMWGYFTVTP